MKCLEKDRTRRYETANGLAADLKRHMNNEPVVARPPSAAYRFQKAWRRDKFAYSAVAAIVAALVVGLGVSMWQARVAAAARDGAAEAQEKAMEAEAEAMDRATEAETQRMRAERVERIARHRAYAADMNLIQRSLEMHDLGTARRLLDRYRPAAGEEDLRGWEWRYLWQLCRSDAVARLRQPDNNGLLAVSSSGDGRWIEFNPSGRTPPVAAYDWTRREADRPAWAQTNVQELMWSPRGMTAVALTRAGTNWVLQVVDGATGRVLNTLGAAPERVFQWRISADGGTLALIGLENGVARLSYWRLPEGKGAYLDEVRVEAQQIALPLAISTDGSLLAFRSVSPSSLTVWDLRNHRELWTTARGGEHMTTSAAFSPDAARLFTGGGYAVGTIRVWNARTGEETGPLEGHRYWVSSFTFTDEGNTLVSGSADQTIRFWDLRTMRPIRVLQGHQSEVWSLLIHPSTGLLLSGGQNGEVLAWDLSSPANAHARLTLTNAYDWRFQKDSLGLIVINRDSPTVTRRSGPGLVREETLLAQDGADSLQISDSGNWAVSTVSNNVQRIWSLNPPRLADEWVGADDAEFSRLLSEQGRVLITFVPEKRLIRQWNLDSRKPVRSWPLPPSTRFFTLSPDGGRLLLLCDRAEESLWINLETGEIQEAHIPAGYYSFNFSPDGGLLGVATEPHVAHVWKVPSFEPFADLRGHMMGPKGIGFSADARRIATTGSGAQGVIFWDAEYHLELLTLPARGGLIKSSRFSSDGRYYGAGDETMLTVWMAPTFDEIAAAEAKEKAEGWQP
jgi:eukaryotic-like serine/threonine-protein kinase